MRGCRGNGSGVEGRAVDRLEARVVPLPEDQREIGTGQHDGFAALSLCQSQSCPHEHLSLRRCGYPCACHRDTGVMHSRKIGRRDDLDSLQHAVEAGLHHDLGAQQTDPLQSTPHDFDLHHLQQIDLR